MSHTHCEDDDMLLQLKKLRGSIHATRLATYMFYFRGCTCSFSFHVNLVPGLNVSPLPTCTSLYEERREEESLFSIHLEHEHESKLHNPAFTEPTSKSSMPTA